MNQRPSTGYAIRLVCLLGILFSALHAAPIESSWQKVRDENDVIVYTRDMVDTDIIKVKTRVRIDAPMQKIQAIIENVSHRPQWVPYLQESAVIRKISDKERIEYSLFAAPWPASDRDFVYRITQKHNDDERIIYRMISETSDLMPENVNIVRAELIESIYTLSALNKNQTEVELIFYADLKGWLPTWIINIVQRTLPYQILVNLREEATKE